VPIQAARLEAGSSLAAWGTAKKAKPKPAAAHTEGAVREAARRMASIRARDMLSFSMAMGIRDGIEAALARRDRKAPAL